MKTTRPPFASPQAELEAFKESHPCKHLAVDELDWDYIATGEEGDAILFLGGAMAGAEAEFRMIERYEGRFRTISPSYPGCDNAGRVVDGLASLLDAEGVERAHVHGHSLGAAMAHVFVRRYPKRVEKLVLSDFGLYTLGHRVAAKAFLDLPRKAIRDYYLRETKRATEYMRKREERDFIRGYFGELLERSEAEDEMVVQLGLLLDVFDRGKEYGIDGAVSLPGRVLILNARDDRGFSQAERARLAATYPGAETHVFKSGGHLVEFVHPNEYFAVLDRFLGVEG